MSFSSLLNQTADIQTRTTTVGTMGDALLTWATAESSACYIEVSSQYSGRVNGRDGVSATHLVFLPQSTTVDTSMRLVIDGKTYYVISVESPRGHHKEVYVVIESSPQSE